MALDATSPEKMDTRTGEHVPLRSARPSASDSCPFLGSSSFIPGGPNTRYSEVTPSKSSPELCTPPLKTQPPSSMPPGLRSLLHNSLVDFRGAGNKHKTLDSHIVLSTQNPLFGRSPSPVAQDLQQLLSMPAKGMQRTEFGPGPALDGLKSLSWLQTLRVEESTREQSMQRSSSAANGHVGPPESDELCQMASPWPEEAGVQGDSGSEQQFEENRRQEEGDLQLTFWERLELARSGVVEERPAGTPAVPSMAFDSLEASFRTPSDEDLPLAEPYSPATGEEGGRGTNSSLQSAVAGVEELQHFSERLRDETAVMAGQEESEAAAVLVRGSGIGRFRLSEAGPCVVRQSLQDAERKETGVMGGDFFEHPADATSARAGRRPAFGVCEEDGMQAIVNRILGRSDLLLEESVRPPSNSLPPREKSYGLQEAYREGEDLDDWIWEDIMYNLPDSQLFSQASGMGWPHSELRKEHLAQVLAGVARKPDSLLTYFVHYSCKQLKSVADSIWLPMKLTSDQAKVPPASVATGAVLSFVLTVLLYRHVIKQRKR